MNPDYSVRVRTKISGPSESPETTLLVDRTWGATHKDSLGLDQLTRSGCARRRSVIELIVTYLLGESAPWLSFVGEAPDLFQPWSFDVTCRDAVLGRRAADIVGHSITSDSTALVCLSLLHFGGFVPSDDPRRD
jgi:hypothetical protein